MKTILHLNIHDKPLTEAMPSARCGKSVPWQDITRSPVNSSICETCPECLDSWRNDLGINTCFLLINRNNGSVRVFDFEIDAFEALLKIKNELGLKLETVFSSDEKELVFSCGDVYVIKEVTIE